ncbi:MAG: hypothetical protein CR988_01610 [Treponema sp.]|nr:MAG: hypothetical protein CR988_01610 [Treponema sp.]
MKKQFINLDLRFKGSKDLPRLMKDCKLKPNKAQYLCSMQKSWDKLSAEKIPRAYLDYIHAEKEKIESCAEEDMQNFLYFANQEISPKTFSIRFMPAVYGGGKLPGGLSIEEATEFVRQKIQGKKLMFWFNFSQLKTVYFRPDGSSYTIWYTPEIKWTEEFLFTGSNGSLIGKSFLG